MRRGGSLDYFLAGVFLVVIFWKPVPALTAGPVSLVPINCCDGLYEVAQVQGEQVWQNLADSDYLYVDIPNDPDFVPGMPVYVQVIYYDTGYGTIELHYDSTRGDDLPSMYFRSETHTRSSRVDTGGFAVSYHELALPALSGRQNGGADFRLSLLDGNGVPNAVKSVVVQRAPFDDPGFQTALSRPWLKPYAGPTRDDVDATTLRGKLMVGYQGWFRAPNDTADSGRFLSWCHDEGTMAADNLAVDQWPDLTGFEDGELFPAGSILTGSGQPARVFSSTTRETVRRHFHWMRKYNIDGVFLERFVHPERSGAWGHEEWVLHHVREAANLEGRLWAIEYDVSALEGRPDSLDIIRSDWQWLVDVVRILDDPRYAHEGEQPVVFVWGLPFPDRGFDVATADAIVEYLKNDPTYGGNYVIGGVRSDWRTNPIFQPWFEHFQRYDALSSWMPDDADYLDDALQLASWSMDYFPHAHPGFSWANLQKEPAGTSALVPREGGNFFWDKLCHAVASNSGRLVVGMFDEYNEGTAIMPMSDDPPDPPAEWGRFITNEGRPSDWWMLLAGEGRAMLLGQRPADDPLPEASQLANRSNTGAEIFADLGSEDRGFGLLPVPVAYGNTSAVTFGGRDCRVNTTAGTDLYFYFNVDAAFAAEEAQGLDVTIEVEYLDEGGDVDFSLEYDGLSGPYTSHAKKVVTSGSNLWTTVRFEIADAFFGGRQNSGADFRLVLDVTRSAQLHIDRIRVLRDDEPEGWTQNRNPDLPATPNPADNAADSGTDPRLSWTGGDPDTGDTTTYDVYFGTDAAPPLVRSGYGAQDYDPGPLELGTTYFWRIVASDAHGAQTVGPLWTFTTVSAKAPGTNEYVVVAQLNLWYYGPGFYGGFDKFDGSGERCVSLTPLLGETYYSADPAVIRQQIEWAAAYGVDAFSLEWMTPRGIPGSLEDNIDDAFLQAPNLFKIRWCIFYDFVLRLLQTPGLDVDISQSLDFDNPEIFNIFVSDFAHFASKYFGHPQYLAIDGRPVVYIWATNACTGNLAGAMQAARAAAATYGFDVYVVGEEVMANAFDGAHASQFDANTTFTFLIPGADASWADVGEAAVSVDGIFQNWRDWIQGLKVAGRDDPVVFQPAWAPQFDDRLFRDGFPEGGDPIYVPAMNRQQVVAMAETARRHARPAGASGMKLVWLNTFNGWAETTTVEPTADLGPKYPAGNYGFDMLEVVREVFGPETFVSGQDGGSNASSELWIKAILQVPGSPVTLIWKEVGADTTPSGDQVISGYFYADPADFAYGSPYNPEVFVKIYIAASGWCNIAFNHVTVDPVTVYSAHRYAGAADQTGSATLESRLVQHEYTGVAIDTSKQSSGGTSGSAGALGYTLGSNLWSNAVLQVAGNPVTLIWKEVGTDTTPSGAKVISGYFYADPATFAYGSAYNPEVFVKVYIDPTGWANMAFNHVTVDPVSIDSAHGYAGAADQSGTVTLNGRLLEHTYTGVSTQ